MNKNLQIRKWQFIGIAGLGFFYFFIYRTHLAPKAIYNSVLYHNTLKVVNSNKIVEK